LNVKGL